MKLWIYGKVMSGKTTFASQFENAYIISTDGNAEYTFAPDKILRVRDYKELNEKIENKDSYKQELRSFASKFNETKRKLNLCSNKIKIKEIKSKYDSFPAEKRYTDYTGIDKDYFVNIK